MPKSLLVFIFNTLLIGNILCQDAEVKKLGVEEGLSSNYVVSITQDRQGYLWFATESGLNRFDGRKFVAYKKRADDESISGNNLNKVYADDLDNFVYVATQRDGLNRINTCTGEVKHYKHDALTPSSIVTNDITNIAPATDGGLWISTFSEGVEHFDRATEEFTHFNKQTYPTLVSNRVWCVGEDSDDNLYIGHVDAGLSIISLKTKKIKNFRHSIQDPNSLPSDIVRVIFIDTTGNVWIGTDNGLALYRADTESFIVFKHRSDNPSTLPSNVIYAISQLKDGRLCVGTEKGGLSFLDINKQLFLHPEDLSFETIRYSDDVHGLSNSTVRDIFQDSFGNIWLGTYGGGANFIGHRSVYFHTWTYSPIQTKERILNNPVAWGITHDLEDRAWVGTDGGGINIFENRMRTKIISSKDGSLQDNAVISAMRDRDGNMWFGTYKGELYVFDRNGSRKLRFTVKNQSNDIRVIFQDNKRNVWIGSTAGIYRYSPGQTPAGLVKLTNPQNSFNLVRAIAQDNQGNFYIGFFGQGIVVLDSLMNVKVTHHTKSGLPSNTINHLFRDSKGRIWASTAEGLVCFKNTTQFETYNDVKKSEPIDVRAATEDMDGNIWFSTSSGIGKLVPTSQRFFHYNYHYGIPSGDFMSGSVSQNEEGYIFFGSQNGVCYFDPRSIPTQLTLPETKISSFKVLTNDPKALNPVQDITPNGKTVLSYDQNTLDISFSVLDYALNPLVEYSYQLKGLDDSWYNVDGNNVVFRNIPPGKYTLQVRSRAMDQDWSSATLTQEIEIHPPIWLSWWAKLGYFAFAASIIIVVLRFYKRKIALENTLLLEKMNLQQEQDLHQERIRFFTNITHELKTPLTLILGPLEDMKQDNELSPHLKQKVSVIYKSSTRLMGLVKQMLEFQKIEDQNKLLEVRHADVLRLVEDIGMKYSEYSLNRKIKFEIACDEKEIYLYYDADVLGTILENLLSNAFKYTNQGTVTLSIKKVDRAGDIMVEFTVSDTGKGIPLDEQERIFDRYYQVPKNNNVSGTGIGLALVRRLTTMHEGEISVRSIPGEGSAFILLLHMDNTYPSALHVELPEDNIAGKMPSQEDDTKEIVLVVEDDHDVMGYIYRILSNTYRVITAGDGKKGLDKAFDTIPDIIVSDVMMPEMDGLQMSNILKNDLRTSHIPVILLTAKDGVEHRMEGYKAGVDSYLVKPFNASLLESRILNLLESRKKLASLLTNIDTRKADSQAFETSLSSMDRTFLDKVRTIIHDNLLSDKVDVVFLAERLHMSHSTLYRKIKGLTGMTVNEFTRKIKIEFAAELLDRGEYTISEVASMVGINSLAYFKQCFKDQFGMTAMDYTKRKT